MPAAPRPNPHAWHFARLGGLDQVVFTGGADVVAIDELDQRLWVALSCPTNGVVFDKETLALLDADKDGRIRPPELIAAVQWVRARLSNLDGLGKGAGTLMLSAINTRTPEGERLLVGAKRLLANLGKPDALSVSLEDVADTVKVFAQTQLNGDGIVPAEAAEDQPELAAAIGTIIELSGGKPDRSGKPGVDQAAVDAFFAAVDAFLGWSEAGEGVARPFGEATAAAHAAFVAVQAKLEDYFTRSRAIAFDPRAEEALRGPVDFYALLASASLTPAALEALPLARLDGERALPLREGVNPAWGERLGAFEASVVRPLLGDREHLTEEDLRGVARALAPFGEWLAKKPATNVEPLGLERLRALARPELRAGLGQLIAADLALAEENATLEDVGRLVRYQRDLGRFLESFVSLADLYRPEGIATFQVGRLYLDARVTELCVHVDDVAKHATLAASSKMYLAYCELTRSGSSERRTICAAFTAGGAESLWVGRNGLFYDREGKDWHAVIVKVVESQISLREAFWSPWKKIAGMIGAQVTKLLAGKEAAAQAAAQRSIADTGAKVEAGAPPKPTPAQAPAQSGAAIASSVAAMGIAVGFLSTAVASLLGFMAGVPLHKTLLGLLGVLLVVSAPSVVIAYFKLRARDLAAVLNASGWAINGRILLSMRLGRRLTRLASIPSGAHRELTDPYADPRRARFVFALVLVTAAALFGAWKLGAFEALFASEAEAPAAIAPSDAPSDAPSAQ